MQLELYDTTRCSCGDPVYIKKAGLCSRCYQQDWHRRNPDAYARYRLTHDRLKRPERLTTHRPCDRCSTPIAKPKRYCAPCREHRTLEQSLRCNSGGKPYQITPVEYRVLLHKQHGRCAICDRDNGTRRLNVDHDHATGHVRGLLCSACHRGIGLLRDDPSLLRAALRFLESTTPDPSAVSGFLPEVTGVV